MYSSTQSYLYKKKSTLCKKPNDVNSSGNPNRILNLSGVPTLQLTQTLTSPTTINPSPTLPFYEVYTIDPSGELFGQTPYPCDANTWKKYVVIPNVREKC